VHDYWVATDRGTAEPVAWTRDNGGAAWYSRYPHTVVESVETAGGQVGSSNVNATDSCREARYPGDMYSVRPAR
jgi:hypothetical protein